MTRTQELEGRLLALHPLPCEQRIKLTRVLQRHILDDFENIVYFIFCDVDLRQRCAANVEDSPVGCQGFLGSVEIIYASLQLSGELRKRLSELGLLRGGGRWGFVVVQGGVVASMTRTLDRCWRQ